SAFSVETEREREKGVGLRSGEGVRACALCPSGGGGRAGLGAEGGNGAVRGDETSSSEDASCAGGEATGAAIGEGTRAELLCMEEQNDAGADWGREELADRSRARGDFQTDGGLGPTCQSCSGIGLSSAAKISTKMNWAQIFVNMKLVEESW